MTTKANASPADNLIKVPEAAKLLKIGERAVRSGIAEGTIPSVRLGKSKVYILRRQLLELIGAGGPETD